MQNTYLSTFQSLGALGLLLGTVGLAVVQLRSVLERRGELALMRAGGFRRGRLVRMVVWENAVLLLGGLAVGCVAAAVALIPQWAPQAGERSLGDAWRCCWARLRSSGWLAGWLATRSALRRRSCRRCAATSWLLRRVVTVGADVASGRDPVDSALPVDTDRRPPVAALSEYARCEIRFCCSRRSR